MSNKITFPEQLKQYKDMLDCNQKDFAAACDLTPSVISRYLNGEREPSNDSAQLTHLATGIVTLSNSKGITLDYDDVYNSLADSTKKTSSAAINSKIDKLITSFEIKINSLSEYLNYDPSYISRIRNGQRNISSVDEFVKNFVEYMNNNYNLPDDNIRLAKYIDCSVEDLNNPIMYKELLSKWLISSDSNSTSAVSFLDKLDSFDLNEYIKSIHFDELKVPTVPFQLHKTKDYYGLEQMKSAELDFLKATVLSPSMEPVYMCSDMPMEDMAADKEFGNKWMFGLAMVLKKGLTINIMHNLNRPFEEMLLGLESWIPLYMTGQVNPYYQKEKANSMYGHLTYLSGSTAMYGECITGYHADGKYHLTQNKREIEYYKNRMEHLMSKSHSLMDIYTADNKSEFNSFVSNDCNIAGDRRRINSSLPIYTISDDILDEILQFNKVSEVDCELIRAHVKKERENFNTIISHSKYVDEYYVVSDEDFDKYPPVLSLCGCFYDKDIVYTKELFSRHLAKSQQLADNTENYSIKLCDNYPYRHINLYMNLGRYSVISKAKSPAIHFVVRHNLLRNALEAIQSTRI